MATADKKEQKITLNVDLTEKRQTTIGDEHFKLTVHQKFLNNIFRL